MRSSANRSRKAGSSYSIRRTTCSTSPKPTPPNHLIVSLRDPWPAARRITTAGSVFVGDYAPESAGDYASGTNHTLPTGGCARAYSGVNIDSFLRRITYQELTREGLRALAPTVVAMARAEGLDAHAEAVRIRLEGGVR